MNQILKPTDLRFEFVFEDLVLVLIVIQAGINKKHNHACRAGQPAAGEKWPVSLASDPIQLG